MPCWCFFQFSAVAGKDSPRRSQVNFSAEIPNSRITATVTEFPSLVVCESIANTTGTYSSQDYAGLLAKNHEFYEKWTHDPRPMVVRIEANNRHNQTQLRTVVVEFTDGDSVMFSPGIPGANYWEPGWDKPLTEETGRRAVAVARIAKTLSRTLGRPSAGIGDIEAFVRGCQERTGHQGE